MYTFHEYSISNFENAALLRCATFKLYIIDLAGLINMEMFASVLIPHGYFSEFMPENDQNRYHKCEDEQKKNI